MFKPSFAIIMINAKTLAQTDLSALVYRKTLLKTHGKNYLSCVIAQHKPEHQHRHAITSLKNVLK